MTDAEILLGAHLVEIGDIDRANVGEHSELNHVHSSWGRSYQDHRPGRWAEGATRVWRMDANVYAAEHSAWRALLLAKPSTVVRVARANDGTYVVGWVCWSTGTPTRLHYVYVKKNFRRLGIARRLLDEVPSGAVEYTHWTPAVVAMKLPKAWDWNPMSMWRL